MAVIIPVHIHGLDSKGGTPGRRLSTEEAQAIAAELGVPLAKDYAKGKPVGEMDWADTYTPKCDWREEASAFHANLDKRFEAKRKTNAGKQAKAGKEGASTTPKSRKRASRSPKS